MPNHLEKPLWEEEIAIAEETEQDILHEVIVWNDDVNTFDWVIQSLIEICHHSAEQAEQCAMFIHYKGKYAVQKGAWKEVKIACDALIDRGIQATVA